MTGKKDAKYLRIYFILAYVIFWILLALTGLLISLEVPQLIQNIMKNICSWTPTFVILLMFKKLYPNITFQEYLKRHFTKKTNPGIFISSFLLQVSVVVAVVLVFFMINNKSLNTITFIGVSSIIPAVVMDLTSGALGEELGWRGYAINILQKKYFPFKAGLIIGLIWGLWHLPLILLSGYSGMELVCYAIAFMLAITSFSIVITFFYNKTKNILIAMWMHFWFNFLLKIVIIDLLSLLMYISVGYLVVAAVLTIFNRNEMLKRKSEQDMTA